MHAENRPGPFLASLVISLAISGPTALADPPTSQGPSSADKVIEEILARNPDLRATDEATAAARHRVPQVGSLPDPVFMVGLSNLPLSRTASSMTGVQFELSQTFPWFGKLGAMEQVAAQDVEIQRALRIEQQNALRASAWAGLWELRYLAEHRKLAEDIRRVLEHFAQVAEATYTSGAGRQQDLIKPVVEQHRIDDLLVGIERQSNVLVSQINALRSRPPGAPIDPPAEAAPDDGLARLDPAKLAAYAQIHNPMLKLRGRAIAKQEAALEVAEKDFYPNFSVALQYRVRWIAGMDPVGAADYIGVGLGVSLPVYFGSKQSEREEEVQANLRAEQARKDSTWNQILDGLTRLIEQIEQDRAQVEIYRTGIIPDTQTALNSSLGDYQAGNLEFLSVLDNLMSLFRTQVDLVRRTTRIQANLARLDHLLGGPWREALGDQGSQPTAQAPTKKPSDPQAGPAETKP